MLKVNLSELRLYEEVIDIRLGSLAPVKQNIKGIVNGAGNSSSIIHGIHDHSRHSQ